jgi:TRAP-type transport system periplasmic protein
MKKFVLFFLALSLAFVMVLVGCSSTPTPSSAPATKAAPATSSAPAAPATSSAPAAPSAKPPVTSAAPAAPTTAAAPAKVYNLKYSHEQAVDAYYSLYGHVPYGQNVAKATNGAVKITVYDSQTLMKSQQLWEGVKAGTADMGWLFTGYFPGQFTLAEVSTLPFMFPNAAVGGKVTWQIYNKYPEIQGIFKDVKVLAAWTTEPYFIVSRSKFYKTVDDWNNMKIRAPGGPPTDFVKAMGGQPLLKGMPDCYMDLKNGVFDAMPIPAEAYMGFKIYEVAPYATYVPTVAMYHALVMNLNTWNGLPKNVQDQMMSVSGEPASVMFSGGVFDKARADLKATTTKAGITLQEYTVPPEEQAKWIDKAAKPVWAAWVNDMKSKGVTNAQQILDDTIALSKQYSK